MNKMVHAKAEDVIAALAVFEYEFQSTDPKAAFSIGTITNEFHAIEPRGAGFCVTLSAYGETVFVKNRETILAAMMFAIKQIRVKAGKDECVS